MPTISVENYLKAIYHLQSTREDRVNTKAIAESLDISQPSVTSMLKALAVDGLVDYAAYKGVRLSDAGRAMALHVIRNHRLIEMFLVQTLGYGWDEVHDEAERLEHAMSGTLADRIEAFLGFPKFDPHGDPIPSSSGELPTRSTRRLADVQPPDKVRITRVLDQEPAVLRYLHELGLRPDVSVQLDKIHPFDGPLELSIDGLARSITLSRSLAQRVLVNELG